VPLEPGRQLSLFGVEAGDPAPADLAGLLAGPGEVVRMGGTARVSIAVDAAWRVHVLAAEFSARRLAASWLPAPGGGYRVRTAYTGLLSPLAAAWLQGGGKRPPSRFHLNGHRLRLWVAAAGTAEPLGFLLRLGAGDEPCWEPVGAALAAIGLPGALVPPRVVARIIPAQIAPPPDEKEPPPQEREQPPEAEEETGKGPSEAAPVGPAYRITGRRRLARLVELVGERPAAAPAQVWPAVPA